MIPKSIHLVNKTQEIQDGYQKYFNSIRDFHPQWNIKVYDDVEARRIVATEMPGMLEIYDSYERDIQRADIFRLIVVYLYGGFYMDLDMLCLREMDDLCSNQVVLGEEKTMTAEECREIGLRDQLRIANYMFGAIPGHPFLSDVINAAAERSRLKIMQEDDILESTGPGLLTRIYHQHQGKYNDITLLANKTKKCMKWCDTISCHFGDYAAHFHQGSWRWENK